MVKLYYLNYSLFDIFQKYVFKNDFCTPSETSKNAKKKLDILG